MDSADTVCDDAGNRISRRKLLGTVSTGLASTSLLGSSLATSPSGQYVHPANQEYDIDVIRENVWVETGTDTDDTGEQDRVHVEIARPATTDDEGEQLPVVLRPDPYRTPQPDRIGSARPLSGELGKIHFSRDVELYRPTDDADDDTADSRRVSGSPATPGRAQDEPFFYEQVLVPEGYIFAYVSPIGSSLSTGCNRLGGPAEIQSVKAVVDWLNGRETAYGSRDGTETVDADWTKGTTGLFGGSYRGALANGVATTGVDGLETIVPIRSISSWYHNTRSNGAVISPLSVAMLSGTVTTRKNGERCDDDIVDIAKSVDRDTGNYNDFWAKRNYVTDADDVTASVLLVHGLYDEAAQPWNFSRWLDALREHDVPYHVWLHQGGHGDPKDRHPEPWLDLLKRWLAYWLKDEDNGVMDGPRATLEREDGELVEYADWPHPESQHTTLEFTPGGEELGGLTRTASENAVSESLVDNSEVRPAEFTDTAHSEHRLVYRTPELTESLHVSGTTEPTLEISFDSRAALVSLALVDYGPEEAEIVNRGWMNPQNRDSLRESRPIEPGESYELEFPIQPVDYVFEPGHRLGIMLYSSDYDVTKRPPSSPELTFRLEESSIDLPLVGGASAFGEAMPDEESGNSDNSDVGESEGETGGESGTDGESTGGDATATDAADRQETDSQDTDDETTADDTGPGLGVVSALTGLGGVGYLLKRRRSQKEQP